MVIFRETCCGEIVHRRIDLSWPREAHRGETISCGERLRLAWVCQVLEAILGTGGWELVPQLVFPVDQFSHTYFNRPNVVTSEIHHFIQRDGELCDHATVNVSQQLALHIGEYTIPGHAGHHIRVDWGLPHPGLGQAQDLCLTLASTVPHIQEQFLRSKQRSLDTVLVEARILPNAPKFLPKMMFLD